MTRFSKGSRVIYLKQKAGTHPPSRKAHHVHAAAKGEIYDYIIEKYRVVERVDADEKLLLRTPRGNRQVVRSDDPGLRPATWLERFRHRRRFAKAAKHASGSDQPADG